MIPKPSVNQPDINYML